MNKSASDYPGVFSLAILESYFVCVNYPAPYHLFLITDYRTGSVKDSTRQRATLACRT